MKDQPRNTGSAEERALTITQLAAPGVFNSLKYRIGRGIYAESSRMSSDSTLFAVLGGYEGLAPEQMDVVGPQLLADAIDAWNLDIQLPKLVVPAEKARIALHYLFNTANTADKAPARRRSAINAVGARVTPDTWRATDGREDHLVGAFAWTITHDHYLRLCKEAGDIPVIESDGPDPDLAA